MSGTINNQSNIGQAIEQEPVAIRYDFDGYGYQYMDSGSGSDWQTRVIGEPLYTHPMRELTNEEIKAVYGEYFDVKNFDWLQLQCIQAILRKAQQTNSEQVPDFFFMENDLMGKR